MKYRVLKVTDREGTWYYPQYKRFLFWSMFTEVELVGYHILDEEDIRFLSLAEADRFLSKSIKSTKPTTEIIPYSG